MEKCINTKVAGIVLWVTWLRPHGPYMLHRDHPDMRTTSQSYFGALSLGLGSGSPDAAGGDRGL